MCLNNFIHGGVMVFAAVAALFFYKFWSKTKDRLFGFFAFSFVLFSVERILLLLIDPTNEAQPFIYSFRLMAFLIIIWGVIDKNRKTT